jgi:oxygen-independent coproporphyrinogen-3 oxidase
MTINRALAIANRFPHDFTIQYPPRREYSRDYFQAQPDPVEISRLVTAAPTLLLYVHVPFCAARCSYCNFAIDLQKDRGYHARYVTGLRQQLASLDSRLRAETKVQGIDIGGGTPTILDDDLLAGLLQQLYFAQS